WNRSKSSNMLPCKKRRTAVTESMQQQDDQEGDDSELASAVKAESLSWGQRHESAVCPEVQSMHDVEDQLSMEDPSLSSKMLAQHGPFPVLEAVDVAISQEITLPSMEPSHSLSVHMDTGRLQATPSRKAKNLVFQPELVTSEEGGDHPVIEEPGEEVKAEGEEQENEESDKRKKPKKGTKRKRDGKCQEQATMAHDLRLDDMLDRTLEDGAKQHNLTAVNVRNILHEVITNEHVVAMMKAAISETEDMPLFEPKMTRSKLKEVVEKGVVIPTWNISPIKKANEVKPPQFVDIHLEEDDSSDEEYQPDEEEEDETAEESLLESDVESTASSPRGVKRSRLRMSAEVAETDEDSGMLSEVEKVATPAVRHISAEVVPMGPPPPPKPKQTRDSAFMEKLNAVDEELASSPVCMDSFQPMEDSLIAFRTRSKMPLKDVPLGQLEAELQAPDITPDMYDPNTADDEDWKVWLGGLLNDDVENEDEADDDDDPEYNFLEDLDEPDTEDFRTDRAVRITKKEVNGLMEELFETFQDEMGFSNMEEDGPEEEERVPESRPNFNTPQTLRFEELLANLLNERHRTVKELLEQLKMKKSSSKPQPEVEKLTPQKEAVQQTLILDPAQRSRLQQQMQQHVQLLTQIYLLSTSNPNLSSEASTTRVFLKELGTFAENSIAFHQQFNPKFQTLFQPCNWVGAMQLIEDFTHVSVDCSPHKTAKKSASGFPCLPKQVAWILATNKVFMYPELLPVCSLKANNPRDKIIFTKAEDNLLALGLKHFEGTEFPKPLISKYLVTCKTAHQLTVRIKNLNQNRAPNNVIKFYKKTKQLPTLLRCCDEIQPHQWKPPIEKEEHRLPFWLKASLQSIQDELRNIADSPAEGANVSISTETSADQQVEKGSPELGSETRYPLLMPKGVVLKLKPGSKRFSRRAWRQKRPLIQKPLLIQPSLCVQPVLNPGKIASCPTQSEVQPSNRVVQIPHLIQPATVLQTLPGFPPLGVSGEDGFESPAALSAKPSGPEGRTSFPFSESQPPLPSSSTPKIMLPSLAPSKFRKPYVRRKPGRRKGGKVSPCVKPAPIIHPTPVIFTVPAATVKVVSLASGCNVIQPVNAAVAPNPQTIPVTTLLVNPTSFPCPLSQPLMASSISPLIVSGNPLTLPVPSIPEEKTQVNLDIAEGKNVPQNPNSMLKPQDVTPFCATVFSKEEPRPWRPISGTENQETCSESSACGWTVVKKESQEGCSESSACGSVGVKVEEAGHTLEPGPQSLPTPLSSTSQHVGDVVKVEAEDCADEISSCFPEHDLGDRVKEECSMEMDGGSPQEKLSSGGEMRLQTVMQMEEPRPAKSLSVSQAPPCKGSTPPSMDQERVLSSPPGKPEDSANADCQSVGTPAGPDTGGEKGEPEEDEEEDFDDLTQDEEDELSSASEESVLSVPELQETMEKLTWLASERSMSQEAESEEENSQEENSEPEEEEEEEAEGMEALQKEDEVNEEAIGDAAEKPPSTSASPKTAPETETSITPPGENIKAAGKGRNNHRVRNKRGSRARVSKDTSKLLLLYDEDILDRDPLREQKDLAFAQAYLTRVREALQHVPGKYEDFLQVIYEFESSTQRQTAVDLYKSLQILLEDWPQLLKDFAAFLLPEQALSCGLFEEQQAFEKSRRFLRQLEICFAENPSQHQKIIKVLQGCADCLPQDTTELKTQMWQLLKGHDHLQDEFSIFFDHLRPAASRMGDFEEINWTEEKEYEFDGFEEVILPDVEEEEEPAKVSTASKSKRRKEIGVQNHEKETEWPEGAKDCSCSCHEGGPDLKLKKSKRRNCHCSSKVCDSKSYKSKEPLELVGSSPLPEAGSVPGTKEAGQGKDILEEEPLEEQETEATQVRAGRTSRKGETPMSGSAGGGTLLCSTDGTLLEQPLEGPTRCSPETPQLPQTGVVLSSVRRNQAGPEVVSCLGISTILPEEGEAQKAVATLETTVPLPDASETEELPGIVELPIALPSPVSSRTRDTERRHIYGKAGTQSWLLESRVETKTAPICGTSAGVDALEITPDAARQIMAEDSGTQGKGPEGGLPKISEATVCANNSKVSSTGEKVVLWTREADRVILTICQEQGAQPHAFSIISQQLGNKTPVEVSHRFRELMQLFHTACEASSEDEDDATSTSNADQLSDHGDLLSEEELDE
ncbi:GON-4 isoform X1, partial [Sigmodon hispidus]